MTIDFQKHAQEIQTRIEKGQAMLKRLEDQEHQVAAQKAQVLRDLDLLSGAEQMLNILIKEQAES